MADTQIGSCEPCKRKKCKCDRQLPHCGQCVSMPPLCKYAENNKRGIPGGYLSALEQRLTDTETALYDALSEIHRRSGDSQGLSQIVPLNSVRPSKASKSSRLAEWTMYPLKSSEDVDHWWMGLREQDHVDQDAQAGQVSIHRISPLPQSYEPRHQGTTLDDFESIVAAEAGKNADVFEPVPPDGRTSTRDISSPINVNYAHRIPARNQVSHIVTYAKGTNLFSLSQENPEQTASYRQAQDAGRNPQSDPLQDQTRGWESSQTHDSATSGTISEPDNDLLRSKHLANTMQHMYY